MLYLKHCIIDNTFVLKPTLLFLKLCSYTMVNHVFFGIIGDLKTLFPIVPIWVPRQRAPLFPRKSAGSLSPMVQQLLVVAVNRRMFLYSSDCVPSLMNSWNEILKAGPHLGIVSIRLFRDGVISKFKTLISVYIIYIFEGS